LQLAVDAVWQFYALERLLPIVRELLEVLLPPVGLLLLLWFLGLVQYLDLDAVLEGQQ
jgi:hypothetical protein